MSFLINSNVSRYKHRYQISLCKDTFSTGIWTDFGISYWRNAIVDPVTDELHPRTQVHHPGCKRLQWGVGLERSSTYSAYSRGDITALLATWVMKKQVHKVFRNYKRHIIRRIYKRTRGLNPSVDSSPLGILGQKMAPVPHTCCYSWHILIRARSKEQS